MEYDSRTYVQNQKNNKRQSGVDVPGDGDVSEPPRVRCRILHRDAVDGVLLDYNLTILHWFSAILWIIFLVAQHG